MYQSHWGLREAAFRGTWDNERIRRSSPHREAFARLEFLVDHGWPTGLLIGPSGSGKTCLLDAFAARRRRESRATRSSLLGIEVQEFYWALAAGLGLAPKRHDGRIELWRHIEDYLAGSVHQQLTTIVLLDDAHRASRAVLEQVVRLINQTATRETRLSIVLATTGDGLNRLGRTLLEMTDLRIALAPWNRDEVAGYVSHCLTSLGGRADTFSDAAIDRLTEQSGGLPRKVDQLAELALIAGADRGLGQIDAETLDAVHHELGFFETSAASA